MKRKLCFSFCLLICGFYLYAQNGVHLVKFSGGYHSPLGIENCGDKRLFIVQRNGKIFICDAAGQKLPRPFLNISGRIKTDESEQGLLGLAFHPNYLNNGFFYVNYINKDGNTQISRFKVMANNRNEANPSSEKFILRITQPYSNHNGGCLRFGPDGFLYIGMGDGGDGGDPQNNAQNPSSLLGKMLRININATDNPYIIPGSNPFRNTAGYRPEIWALGLRNPWRFSFDAANGALLIADVGQEAWEEIDLQSSGSKGGENYGWRCYEGGHAYNTDGCKEKTAYKLPEYEYAHSATTGDCSVTGGFVYRGKNYPDMYGKYYFTDYCSGIIRSITFSTSTKKDEYRGDLYSYSSFGEDNDHELYLANIVNGIIYRVAAKTTASPNELSPGVSLNIYPNPAKSNLIVSYTTTQAEACRVNIFDAMGMQLFTAKYMAVAGTNTWHITLPVHLKGNCYLSVMSASGAQAVQKIVVQ